MKGAEKDNYKELIASLNLNEEGQARYERLALEAQAREQKRNEEIAA